LHIGDMAIRLRSMMSRSVKDVKSTDMRLSSVG
jgi:hypothetical protein